MQRRLVPAAMILAALSALGADWAQFRGPGGAGVSDETGLPVAWSATENVVWRTPLPGPGTSSPIVVGKRVYLTCYTGYGLKAAAKDPKGKGAKAKDPKATKDSQASKDDAEDMNKLMRHVLCIDRATGAILWTKDFKPALPESIYSAGNDSQHGYASSTLASDGRRLYAFFGKSGVYCLDLEGNQVWHASVGTNVRGWGSSNSPVLFKDLVIINASIESGSLVGLDKHTGKEVWRAKNIKSSWNTPVLVHLPAAARTAGGDVPVELVLNESRAVIGFDPSSGKELWRVTGFNGYVCPSVVTDSPYIAPEVKGPAEKSPEPQGTVFVVRGETLAIKAGGRGDVTDSHVLWRGKGSSLVPSPVYHDGRLCWDGKCLDAVTGKEVGRGNVGGKGGYYASPLLAEGRIYYVSRFGGTFVMDAGRDFKKLAHNTFADDDSRTNASPIAHEGCLLLRTDRYLYCLGKK
jgi:outer membrane protein assembly factor BamB